MSEIRIDGIEIMATHGVNPDEKVNPQKFIIDISVHLDIRKAAAADNLEYTVNYATLQKIAYKILLGTPEKPAATRNLIETLAFDILREVHELDERIEFAEVRLHKPEAPLSRPFGDVSVKVNTEGLKPPTIKK